MAGVSAGDVLSHLKNRAGHLWEDVCDLVIRPQRADYTPESLGPKLFRLTGQSPKYIRDDITLENMRGLTLQCSWYKPATVAASSSGTDETLPCVVYLHGNCGCRLDGQEILFLLAEGMTVFTLDTSGSGLSGGEFVSLGFYERQDLACVVDYLHSSRQVKCLGLWGRSMGAVTAIMYACRDKDIKAIVCDSPFSTLRLLVADLVKMHAPLVPQLVIKGAVSSIRSSVMKRAGFDIKDLDTLKYAASCDTPAFIFHGEDDDFVRYEHSQAVADHFRGNCIHHLVTGDHNSSRLPDATDVAREFLRLYLIDKLNAPAPSPPPQEARAPEESDADDDAEAEAAAAAALTDPTVCATPRGLPTPRTAGALDEFAAEDL